jgi:hypothetical protein
MSQLRLALAGDTMLGRKVANAIRRETAQSLVDPPVVDSVREADLFVLNLECCIAERGSAGPTRRSRSSSGRRRPRRGSGPARRRLRHACEQPRHSTTARRGCSRPWSVSSRRGSIRSAPALIASRRARRPRSSGTASVSRCWAAATIHRSTPQALCVLYDLGDFLDDYAVDRRLRNDLGLLFLVDLDRQGPTRLEAVPLKLEFCHTRLADGDDARWIGGRFRAACRALGTEAVEERGRLVVSWRS